MQEIWKTVITEDGIYENYMVSNLGRVKSLNYHREKILSPGVDGKGYFHVTLSKNKKAKSYKVHRLVAFAFIPNIMNYGCIDHKDTNKKNNIVSNLVWVTNKQNCNNELSKINYSKANKGKKFSEETRKKLSVAHKGKVLSEETKNKISENRKGKMCGEKNPKSKRVICLETGEEFASTKEVSRKLGINASHIADVCRGKRKQTGKLTFRYFNQVLFYN